MGLQYFVLKLSYEASWAHVSCVFRPAVDGVGFLLNRLDVHACTPELNNESDSLVEYESVRGGV